MPVIILSIDDFTENGILDNKKALERASLFSPYFVIKKRVSVQSPSFEKRG